MRMLSCIDRRKFIGIVGGTMACASNSGGGWFTRWVDDSDKPVVGIPKQWVDLRGEDVNRYGNFVLDLDLKNITPYMVLSPHFKTRGRTVNSLPPHKMWKKMAPTLKLVDRISCESGLKIKSIVSAYRSPAYNRAVRGRSKSYHMSNQAVDVVFDNMSAWRASRIIRHYRDKKTGFRGGVGTYSSFVHIDTRGYNADW